MQDHWAEYGMPVYISVAAFLGHKPPAKRSAAAEEPNDFAADMMAMYPGGWG
jgi:hypothetical protein